jgi:hypothetical protein
VKRPLKKSFQFSNIAGYFIYYHIFGIVNALTKAIEELNKSSMPQQQTMRFEHDALPGVDI